MASKVSRDRSLLCSSDGRIMLIQSSQNFVSSLTNILHVAQFALNKIDQIRTRARFFKILVWVLYFLPVE